MTDTFPPPPRHVRLRPESRRRLRAFRLITLPLTAVSVLLVLMVLRAPVTRLAGTSSLGRVQEVQPNLKSKGRRLDITFSYDRGDGIRLIAYGGVDAATEPPLEIGQAIPIHRLVIGAYTGAVMDAEDLVNSGSICGGLFIFIWVGWAMSFATVMWLYPMYERRFMTNAHITSGTVTAMRIRGRHPKARCRVTYSYRLPDHAEYSGTAQVGLALSATLNTGSPVTVLYRSTRPAKSMLYEACDHEIVR